MYTESSSPYSPSGLLALAQLLRQHGELLWMDPSTNALAVKPEPNSLKEEEATSID